MKVIIVDDEELPREILAKHIPWHLFGEIEILQAEDGLEGLNACKAFRPDIVISDIKMGRMNGIEMAEEISKIHSNCKFIFLSGYSDKEYLLSAIKLKAVRYVEKPIDLEEVTEAISLAISEIKHERNIAENMTTVFSNNLCLAMTHQKMDDKDISNKLQNLGYNFLQEGFFISAVILIICDEQESAKKEEHRNDFLSILKDSLQEFKKSILIAPKDTDHILIHFSCDENEDVLIEKLYTIYEDESRLKSYKFFTGVGSKVKGMSHIYTSYETAVLAMKRCFFREVNTINRYIENIQPAYTFDESHLGEIASYVKHQDSTRAILQIKKLIKEIKQNDNTQPEYIKNIFTQIVITLLRIAEDRNEIILQNSCRVSMSAISNAYTIKQIEHIVTELLGEFFKKFGDYDKEDIISGINHLIFNQYGNVNLTLNMIAEKLSLTTNYLCYIYKKETGKTINQYITEVRVEKAKELLKVSDSKLYRIAQEVGYQDGKYFVKVFTKIVGIKPREYREKHRDE